MAEGMPDNRVRIHRRQRGWSQDELSRRAGISRTAVSAIEMNRLVPSVAAALALAAAFGCSVEALFGAAAAAPAGPVWAWPPAQTPCRYWHARVLDRLVYYTAEAAAAGVVAHDGVFQDARFLDRGGTAPEATLVLAGCDPAAGLLAAAYACASPYRLLVLCRSSRQALTLLRDGLIHVAGVHFATGAEPEGNVRLVHDMLGEGYRLLRVASWQEGLCVRSGAGILTVKSALRARLRWVGREPGSAARQCQEELRSNGPAPRRLAQDHRGVALAVRCGWADVGVCHRLVSEEAGLRFFSVRQEGFDLCFSQATADDPRIQALLGVIRSASFRGLLGELPGYDTRHAGGMQSVN